MSCDHLRPATVWRKEAEAVTWSGGQDHWHWDNQNYFTTQLQMLVTNIFTSLTAPSTGIRTQGCGEQVMRLSCVWGLYCCLLLRVKVRIVRRKAANCKLKESRLGWTRVFGPWPKVPALLANIQWVRQVSCNTWSVQTWPERQGLGRQLQSVLLVLETQSRARSLIQGPHREYWPG